MPISLKFTEGDLNFAVSGPDFLITRQIIITNYFASLRNHPNAKFATRDIEELMLTTV